MDAASHARVQGTTQNTRELDYLAEAGNALANAFREADSLFDLATVQHPHLAALYGQRLREALLLVMLALGEARRARRREKAARS